VSAEENKKVVHEMWSALYRKDFDAVGSYIAADGHYEDVPAPDAGATGPDNVVKRLRIGLDPVARFEHDTTCIGSSPRATRWWSSTPRPGTSKAARRS
jgi:hypothetical protein